MSRSSVDERAATPLEASRKGAHRARARALPGAVPVVAGVAVILLVVGGVYAVLSGGDPKSSGSVAGAEDDTSTSASASPGASKTTRSSTAASQTPKASVTQAATPVDKSVNVVVLNSVAVQGLASRVKANLGTAGWTVSRTGNSTERNLPTTKIYYPTVALRSTARQLAKDLQFGSIVQNASVAGSGTIKVVLGSDAQ